MVLSIIILYVIKILIMFSLFSFAIRCLNTKVDIIKISNIEVSHYNTSFIQKLKFKFRFNTTTSSTPSLTKIKLHDKKKGTRYNETLIVLGCHKLLVGFPIQKNYDLIGVMHVKPISGACQILISML